MKRSKFIEKQVVRAITQVDAGVPVQELCRKCEDETGCGYRGSWVGWSDAL